MENLTKVTKVRVELVYTVQGVINDRTHRYELQPYMEPPDLDIKYLAFIDPMFDSEDVKGLVFVKKKHIEYVLNFISTLGD